MERRDFIHTILLGSGAMALPLPEGTALACVDSSENLNLSARPQQPVIPSRGTLGYEIYIGATMCVSYGVKPTVLEPDGRRISTIGAANAIARGEGGKIECWIDREVRLMTLNMFARDRINSTDLSGDYEILVEVGGHPWRHISKLFPDGYMPMRLFSGENSVFSNEPNVDVPDLFSRRNPLVIQVRPSQAR